MSEERNSKRSSRGGRTSLFIRNLSYKCRQDDIKKLFTKHVDVKDVYLPTDYRTGDPRGFGFIEFYSNEDAQLALEKADGAEICGSRINVMLAKEGRKNPNEMRDKDHGGRSRKRGGRSRSRSRDRDRRRRSRRSRSRSDSRDRRRSRRDNRRRKSQSSSSSKSRSGSSDKGGDKKRREKKSRSASKSKSKSPEKKEASPIKPAAENSEERNNNGRRKSTSSERSKRSPS